MKSIDIDMFSTILTMRTSFMYNLASWWITIMLRTENEITARQYDGSIIHRMSNCGCYHTGEVDGCVRLAVCIRQKKGQAMTFMI